MLGCFHLVHPVHLSFLYRPFAKAFQMFSRMMWADKEVHLLSWRGITLPSPGESSNNASTDSSSEPWKAIWDHWSWKENILPQAGVPTSQEEHKQGLIHHENHSSGKKTLHISQCQQPENVPPCLHWDGMSRAMAEGTDAPSAASWEAGCMPIQMPLELGFWVFFFFKWEEVENKCHQLQEHT